ncbi:hypothetical protein [Dongia sp.]|uniref:hypothetical protein n=1 Tax=Dongia sp. TaxID=1977262 RepID=UPI0035B0930F
MKNAHLGVAPLTIGGETYRLCFDWEALAAVKTELGKSMSEINVGTLSTPDIAVLVEIGTRRYHGKSLAAADVMEWSPPLRETTQAISLALQYSYFGPDGPPSLAKELADEQREEAGERP